MEPNGEVQANVDSPPEMRPISEMTDSEKLDEMLYWLRYAGQALAAMQSGPMGKMIGNMFNRSK